MVCPECKQWTQGNDKKNQLENIQKTKITFCQQWTSLLHWCLTLALIKVVWRVWTEIVGKKVYWKRKGYCILCCKWERVNVVRFCIQKKEETEWLRTVSCWLHRSTFNELNEREGIKSELSESLSEIYSSPFE